MATRTIKAHFSSYGEAEEAAAKLRMIQASIVELHQWEERAHEEANANRLLFPGFTSSLGNPNLGAGFTFTPAGTWTSITGTGVGDEISSVTSSFLLEAEVDEQKYKKAVSIVQDSGGRL